MNAPTRCAALGFQLHHDANGALSRQAINALLTERACHPVSDRTYRHYRLLLRAGHRDYIPINQCDVTRHLGLRPPAQLLG